jgi:hypothetical protein
MTFYWLEILAAWYLQGRRVLWLRQGLLLSEHFRLLVVPFSPSWLICVQLRTVAHFLRAPIWGADFLRGFWGVCFYVGLRLPNLGHFWFSGFFLHQLASGIYGFFYKAGILLALGLVHGVLFLGLHRCSGLIPGPCLVTSGLGQMANVSGQLLFLALPRVGLRSPAALHTRPAPLHLGIHSWNRPWFHPSNWVGVEVSQVDNWGVECSPLVCED